MNASEAPPEVMNISRGLAEQRRSGASRSVKIWVEVMLVSNVSAQALRRGNIPFATIGSKAISVRKMSLIS